MGHLSANPQPRRNLIILRRHGLRAIRVRARAPCGVPSHNQTGGAHNVGPLARTGVGGVGPGPSLTIFSLQHECLGKTLCGFVSVN